MSDSTLSRENNLKNIQRTLEHCLGKGNFPLEMVGDLDDVLLTLEGAVEILNRLTADHAVALDRQQLLSDMYQLEFLLADYLVLILSDLRPALRVVRGDPSGARSQRWKKLTNRFLGRRKRET
ncbi:MAG: hypothetical protein GY847_24545 [Proteobacteria bacterium]|nr:hypothetical protein [Pseudomonadota bacterium]